MNKKVLAIAVILAVILVMAIFKVTPYSQDFDGHFTMEVPFPKHYSDVSWCWSNKALGCTAEYQADDFNCAIGDRDIIVYYYNSSHLSNGESNLLEYVVNGLTTTYLFKEYQRDGDLVILTNDLGMSMVPTFLVGKCSQTGDEVVFVGGRDLEYVKHFARTIEFK